MEIRLKKLEKSDDIRIPGNILKALNLKNKDKIELINEDDKIIISKLKKEKISLEERFANYKGENLAKSFSWDK